jgi:hypothetical protein
MTPSVKQKFLDSAAGLAVLWTTHPPESFILLHLKYLAHRILTVDMLPIHSFPSRSLQSSLRHRWVDTPPCLTSPSTSTLHRFATRCLSISTRPALLGRAKSLVEGRWYSSHTAPTSSQQSPFSISRICEQLMVLLALHLTEMLIPLSTPFSNDQ